MSARFLEFEEARKFVRNQKIKNKKEWCEYCRTGNKPLNIPGRPEITYKKQGWEGYGDWLGTGNVALFKKSFLTYEEAKLFVNSLGLKNIAEWKKYKISGNKPANIPSYPSDTYKNKGWNGFGDWLGTGNIAPRNRDFLSYEQAKLVIQSFQIKSIREWELFCKSEAFPQGIPKNPRTSYKGKGWIGWSDWLGTNTIAPYKRKFLSFEQARSFVQKLHLENSLEWYVYSKSGERPANIPSSPGKVYKNEGWNGYGDWLGVDLRKWEPRYYSDYKMAAAYVRNLKLKDIKAWSEYCKSGVRPHYIPRSPEYVYKRKGWTSWSDWLGTNNIVGYKRKFKPFEEARLFIRSLQIKSMRDWSEYAKSKKRPIDIPSKPDIFYKESGWVGWNDWLGTNNVAPYNKNYLPFDEARVFVHALKIKNSKNWFAYCSSGSKPADIPRKPQNVYKNYGWQGWGDWLGTGNVAFYKKSYRPFLEARQFAQSLKLPSITAWYAYFKNNEQPNDISKNPNITYGSDGWDGWSDWLGTKIVSNSQKKFLPFEEAKQYVKKLGFKSIASWTDYCRKGLRPENIPMNPSGAYKNKGWSGWGDWLGTGNVAFRNRIYRAFDEARQFVRSLELKNQNHWKIYCKSGNKPKDISSSPHIAYKDKGWKGWGDWLGTGNVALSKTVSRSFEDAKSFIQCMNFKSVKSWRQYCKDGDKPVDIPSRPVMQQFFCKFV